jgi:16S rRNA (uracil1498-N3)-methyltransferase
MARELRRLLIPPSRWSRQGDPNLLALEAAESHYLARVLRFRQGDRLAVVDGCGRLWSAVLESEEQLRLEQPPDAPLEQARPVSPALTLALAVPRRDAELVWRMAAELGAARLQPLLAARGVVREPLPLERWATIIREATEQCERLWLPELATPLSASRCWGEAMPGTRLLATTRRADIPPLASWVQTIWSQNPREPITLAIGPEGGWSEEEERQALGAGWQLVTLGDSILRTSTAAVAGLATLALLRPAAAKCSKNNSG